MIIRFVPFSLFSFMCLYVYTAFYSNVMCLWYYTMIRQQNPGEWMKRAQTGPTWKRIHKWSERRYTHTHSHTHSQWKKEERKKKKNINRESSASTVPSNDVPILQHNVQDVNGTTQRFVPCVCVCIVASLVLYVILSYRRMDWIRPNGLSHKHLHHQRVAH